MPMLPFALVTLEIGPGLAIFLGLLLNALVAGLPAYLSYRVSLKTDQRAERIEATGERTHNAVNSTATVLAEEKKAGDAREKEMIARIAHLEDQNRALMGQKIGPAGEQGVPGPQGQTGKTGG
jgi:hypothetical protein